MKYLPLFFDMSQLNCLVVGAGKVGFRKTRTLLEANPASILVVDHKDLSEEWAEFQSPILSFAKREFLEKDLDNIDFVFAQSSNKELNNKIMQLCKARCIFCNIADAPEDCDFIMPAIVNKGQISIALSTGGMSPALTKKMAKKLELLLEERMAKGYTRQVELLGKLRPLVLDLNMPSSQNAKIFRDLSSENITDLLTNSDKEGFALEIKKYLPEQLHDKLEGIIHDLY